MNNFKNLYRKLKSNNDNVNINFEEELLLYVVDLSINGDDDISIIAKECFIEILERIGADSIVSDDAMTV